MANAIAEGQVGGDIMARTASGGLGIGVIGAGFIAQVAHLPAFAAVPGARLVALADARPGLRNAIAAAHGLRAAASPEALLTDPDVQAVVVCVHRRCQAPLAAAALAAGKPVFSEKPLAWSLAEARAAVALAGPLPYAVGYMKRHDAGVRAFRAALHRELADARLGPVVQVLLRDFCPSYGVPSPPHLRPTEPTATRYAMSPLGPDWLPAPHVAEYDYALNVLSHDINLLRYLFGDIFAAERLVVRPGRSQQVTLAAPDFDVAIALGRSEGEGWDQALEVLFRHGRMRLHLASPLALGAVARWDLVDRDGVHTGPVAARLPAFHAQARNFVAACREGARLDASAGDAINDIALIETLWAKAVWKP
jgi:predicted dehydrogenase